MNKKFIIGGIMFWAGLSGYMGLRVLESYTEDAVYAVLSVIPAQAQEIRYSFLDDSLRLKGVEYEIPDEKVVHKGSIESVEVTKFHRKIMYVKPVMPPYDADELPRVGETFKFTGIVDRIHEGNTVVESRIDSVEMKGWYQRVGMVLDRLARKGAGAEFFEELFRTRIDELKASQIDVSVVAPSLEAPVRMHIDQIDVPGGIRAPRGEEKNTPVHLVLDRLTFGQKEASASVGRLELRALRAPQPEQLGRLVELARAIREGRKETAELSALLVESYEKFPPFGLFSLYDLRVKPDNASEPLTVSSASYALTYEGDGYTDSLKCKDLHVRPETFGDLSGVVKRFAPDGIRLDVTSDSQCNSKTLSTKVSYDLPGLGRFEGASDMAGDFISLKKFSLLGELVDFAPQSLLEKVQINRISARYADSGLMGLGLAAAAQELGVTPEQLVAEARATADAMAKDSNSVLAQLGKVLQEQLQHPGEVSLEMVPKECMSIGKLAETLFVSPQDFPLTVTSRPGQKALFEASEGK